MPISIKSRLRCYRWHLGTVHFSILNATPLQWVIIKIGPVAPAVVLLRMLNMKPVCECHCHSVVVVFLSFVLMLQSKNRLLYWLLSVHTQSDAALLCQPVRLERAS